MKKILSWIWDNVLFLETLFLLAFIPLYPKLPILDIKNTWVYIRAEDFVVLFVLLSWLVLLFRKKITLRTPLTLPILIFWLIGGIATIHGILIIFPKVANVFSNVAFLSFLRHIEYMSLFFIAYHGMKDRKFLPFVIVTLVVTLFAVIVYGFGQKYLGLPAYLTMNEEFAKGIPIQLSALSRVPSTFAGHYDLAAYLVFIIPIMVSLFFGVKNWVVKIVLAAGGLLGFVLLFMTVSRVSFFVLFAALFIVFFFQKKKLLVASIPVVAILAAIFLILAPTLLNRFQSTVSEVDVLVDAKTGQSLGHIKFVEKEYTV
ncbi:MAG: O-antigen polymerase [Microgenomates group bacterium GW2011_GWA2_37_6]|nr:MAG: O-antigen polymerase [Microgenomates group bacterium GW2011_GWA2_37_6]